MAEKEKVEKVDKYNDYKNEALASRVIITELTQKTHELWGKAAELDLQVLGKQKESEALKAKLEALNEGSRQNLAKKNFDAERLAKLETENGSLLRQNGALISENKQIEKLNEIKTALESDVLDLKKANEKLNDSLLASGRGLKELNLQKAPLNLQVETLKKSEAGLKNSSQVLNGENADLKKEIEILKSDAEILKSQNELLMSCEIELNSIKDKSRKRNNNLILFISALAFIANLKHLLAGYLAFLPTHAKTGNPWIDFSLAFVAFLSLDGAIMLFIQHKKNTLAGIYTAGTIALTLISLLWIDIRGCQIAFGVISCIMISGIIYAFSNLKKQ